MLTSNTNIYGNFAEIFPQNTGHALDWIWRDRVSAVVDIISESTAVRQSMPELLCNVKNTLLVGERMQNGCYVTTVICNSHVHTAMLQRMSKTIFAPIRTATTACPRDTPQLTKWT